MSSILFVSGSLSRGGAQRVISLLANEYARIDCQVHLATLLDCDVGYQINDNIMLHDLSQHGNYLRNAAKWISSLRKLIKETKPAIIVSFVGRINILTMLAARGLNIPVLVSERNDPAHDRRKKWEISLCRYFYSKADCVVFQTEYQKEFYGKACEKNGVIIGNPIAAEVYNGEHECDDIISVGKLMNQKNHPMLINAFAEIAEEFPDKKVHIFGEGSLRQELQNLIDAKGLTGRIILEGNSDHIFDMLHKYKYFVMTSDYEGMSNALLEAMVSGMVCVTTAWNGVEDIIKNNVNGYLVPVGDKDSLTNKLRYVLKADNSGVVSNGIKTGKKYFGDEIMGLWINKIDRMVK